MTITKAWRIDPDAPVTDEVLAASVQAGASMVIDRIPPRYAGQVADDVRGYVELVEPEPEVDVEAEQVDPLLVLADALEAVPGSTVVAQKLRAAGAAVRAAITGGGA